jgi:phosphopantothenoylcysteine decarboxylase/phosphopantothenate--cysteine ligase
MLASVLNTINDCNIFIACAAVADYRPAIVETQKIKKNNQEMALTFIKNPDILSQVAALSDAPFTVGFAAETEHLAVHAQQKLTRKNINMIAANDVSNKDIGFNSDQNALQVFWRDENTLLPMTDKRTLARQLLKLIHQHYSRNTDAN